jgi:CobQ-like glutamine amidotransferase family enzyme
MGAAMYGETAAGYGHGYCLSRNGWNVLGRTFL